MRSWKHNALCLLLAFPGAALAAPAPQPSTQVSTNAPVLGANLEGIADYARTNVFVDISKQSRAPGPPDKPYDLANGVAMDKNGWPTDDFGIFYLTGARGLKNVGGVYHLYMDGKAALAMFASKLDPGRPRYDPKNNTLSADITVADDAPQIALSFRRTEKGARNIRFLRPGYTIRDTFTRPFLDHIKRFKVIRFMDWTRTNGSEQTKWENRPLLTDATYRYKGVPWEVAIQLCNETHEDMWINVPHLADDDYVRHLAKLIREGLDKNLHVYVEYSNELWNFGFPQSRWNVDSAKAEVAAGNSPLNFDGEKSSYYWAMRRIGKRVKEVSDIFRTVFGDAAMGNRVRVLLAGQYVNPNTFRQALYFIEKKYGAPKRFIYGLAAAPYFSVGKEDQKTDLTKDQVLDALDKSVDGVAHLFPDYAVLSRSYGLKFLAYEGGPDTFGPHNVDAKRAATFDPKMKEICERYLRLWFSYGFEAFSWYLAGATAYDGAYGTWGLTDDMANQDTPKIRALDGVLAAPVPMKPGHPVPGEIDPHQYAEAEVYPNTVTPGDHQHVGPKEEIRYLISVKNPGWYSLKVTAAPTHLGNALKVFLNDQEIGTPSSQLSVLKPDAPDELTVKLDLKPGFHVIRMQAERVTGCDIRSVRIDPL